MLTKIEGDLQIRIAANFAPSYFVHTTNHHGPLYVMSGPAIPGAPPLTADEISKLSDYHIASGPD